MQRHLSRPQYAGATFPGRGGTRPGHVRAAALTVAACVVGATVLPALSAAAAPTLDGTGTPVSYTEQAAPVRLTPGLTLADGGYYDGQSVEFSVDGGDASDVLSLATLSTPDTRDGVVSIVDGTVYLGNGASADAVGAVDTVRNGQGGQPLRINFTSPFTNPSFETGDPGGWTAVNQVVNLGVTQIAGFTTQDTSTYPTGVTNKDDNAPSRPGTFTTQVQSDVANDGTYALRLVSSGMTTLAGCDVVHGPAVYSDTFPAQAGDHIYFDWRAYAGEDNYHVFGYIIDEDGHQTEVLDSTGGGTTAWSTKDTEIPADGTYRFVFVSGTHDYTCGQAAGASLIIDNVRVFGHKVPDPVAQEVARLVQYSSTSDNPPASRTVSITATSTDGTDTGTATVNITPVDDAPTFGTTPTVTYTNHDGAQTYAPTTGTFSATDPDDTTLNYSLDGARAETVTLDGVEYTQAVDGAYGTLRANDAGQYVFVPDAAAIDPRLTDDEETFAVTVTGSQLSDSGTLRVVIDVPASAPGAPGDTSGSVGDGTVTVTWSAPAWPGGSATTGYRIEVSTDGGETWQTVDTVDGDTTTYTVDGLANGVPVSVRVSATNATGTGVPSAVVTATPVTVPTPVPGVTVQAGDRRADVTWFPPTGDGGTPVTGYKVQTSVDGGQTWRTVAELGADTLQHTVTGLTNGQTTLVQVVAVNAVGDSPASPPAPVVSRTVPGAPTGLTLTPADGAVALSWTAPADDGGAAVTGYRIESSLDGATWTTVVEDTASAATTYTVDGLANGTAVSFRVSALNEAGVGAASSARTAAARTVPGAPAISSIDAKNHSLTVHVVNPRSDGGSAITGFQYSLDGGTTWRTPRVSTSSSLVIGGLTNGAQYSVLVRAVNQAGPGPASRASTASPELKPVEETGPTGVEERPVVAPGTSELTVDGERQAVTVDTSTGAYTATGDGFTVGLRAVAEDGTELDVDSRGRLVIDATGKVKVSGEGFVPGSIVDVWLFSTPYLLGQVTVEADGTFAATLPMPADVEAGEHTVQLNGISADGSARSLSTGVVVLAAPDPAAPADPVDPTPAAQRTSAPLAATGAEPGSLALLAALLLGAGAIATVVSRRRRVRSSR